MKYGALIVIKKYEALISLIGSYTINGIQGHFYMLSVKNEVSSYNGFDYADLKFHMITFISRLWCAALVLIVEYESDYDLQLQKNLWTLCMNLINGKKI